MPQYRIINAEDWGGTWKRPPFFEKLEDPEAYIHHTAGNPKSHMPAEQALREMNQYSQDVKDYSFLDYDFMVHWEEAKDLYTIAEGRGEWMSAATLDRNELGEAVCVMGYFHTGHKLSQKPNPGHIVAVAIALVEMRRRKLIAAEPKIMGHYQNLAFPIPQTGCPGNLFIPHIPEVIWLFNEMIKAPDTGDIMAQLNGVKIRFKSYANQLFAFRMSADTMQSGGIIDDPIVILEDPTAAQKAAIEEQLGQPLKPIV